MDLMRGLAALPLTIVTSVILLFLGVIYFVITLLIVKVASDLVAPGAEANWVLFSAAIVTAASMIGAAIQKESEAFE
jgi:hypothetical protein